MVAQVARALATSPRTFYSSICLEVAGDLHSPPIRAQMTRCILPQETGKVVTKYSSKKTSYTEHHVQVFAMLASLECIVPILSSMIFTNVYNATSSAQYPWQGTFYFGSAGFTFIGI